MSDDVTGKDEAITAQAIVMAATSQAIVMAATYWDAYKPPEQLLKAAHAAPLALYTAIKYLQSLPREDDLRVNEYAMKAILLGRYPDFVKLSAVSTYETDLAVSGREDFLLIVAFRGSEDETKSIPVTDPAELHSDLRDVVAVDHDPPLRRGWC